MNKPVKVGEMLPAVGPQMIVSSFQILINATNEWIRVTAEERTARQEIAAWEKTQLEMIDVQREFLLTGLEKTFDERKENFRRLFDQLDSALQSDAEGASAQVSDLLGAITDLAKTSPFKDLQSPELVVQEFLRNGRVIEL